MAYLQCTIVTGSACVLQVRASGSLTNPTVFSVDGNQGRLLEVTDDLSCSVFSANTIAGLPVVEAFSNYCTVLGQYGGHQLQVTCTSIRGGKCTTASGTYSFIGGGTGSLASGNCAFVGGGRANVACCCYSAVVGGRSNTASGYSFVGNGYFNSATGFEGGIVTGFTNTASGNYSFIGAGKNNTASGTISVVVQGCCNTSSGGYSFVGSGGSNTASAYYSIVVGGLVNRACAACSFIGGGRQNCTTGTYSVVGGGRFNTASGTYSAVLGGTSNTVSAAYAGAFGCNLTANVACTFFVNNLCACGTISGISSCTVSFTSVSSVTATHNFGTKNVHVSVYDDNDYLFSPSSIRTTTTNTVDVVFTTTRTGRIVITR